jgi:calnexin
MPSDWNEEEDGTWEAPLIGNIRALPVINIVDNPDYMGEWKPAMIPNPEYKGPWKAKQIPNPSYFEDLHPHNFRKMVNFLLWKFPRIFREE